MIWGCGWEKNPLQILFLQEGGLEAESDRENTGDHSLGNRKRRKKDRPCSHWITAVGKGRY